MLRIEVCFFRETVAAEDGVQKRIYNEWLWGFVAPQKLFLHVPVGKILPIKGAKVGCFVREIVLLEGENSGGQDCLKGASLRQEEFFEPFLGQGLVLTGVGNLPQEPGEGGLRVEFLESFGQPAPGSLKKQGVVGLEAIEPAWELQEKAASRGEFRLLVDEVLGQSKVGAVKANLSVRFFKRTGAG